MLLDVHKTGIGKKVTKSLVGTVVHMVFHPCHANIEDERTNGIVARAVDNNDMAAFFQDAVHFSNGTLLVGIMVKRITAGNKIEGIIFKGQVFGIANDEVCFMAHADLFDLVVSLAQHVLAEIKSRDLLNKRSHTQTLPR